MSSNSELVVEFSPVGTHLETFCGGIASEPTLLEGFPLDDPVVVRNDWLKEFDPISRDTFDPKIGQQIVERLVGLVQENNGNLTAARVIFRRKSKSSRQKKSILEEELDSTTQYLDGPHSAAACNRGQIYPSLVRSIRTATANSLTVTSVCLANVKLMPGCLTQLACCARLKDLCFHDMTIDMTKCTWDTEADKLRPFMEELQMFTDWANTHLDSFGLSRSPSLLLKAISNSSANGHNSASPYRMCLSAQTFELSGGGGSDVHPYNAMMQKNSTFDLHLMLYGRSGNVIFVNQTAFTSILTTGGSRIKSLEIHCRIDSIPRSILTSLVFLTGLRSLSIGGCTKLLIAGDLTWIARSCPQLEELRIHKSCSEVPTDDYRSVAMYWHNLKTLCLSKAVQLSRVNVVALVSANPHLEVIYLENCKRLGGLHFQLEGVAVWSTELPCIRQLEMTDCGRLTVTSINSLVQHCSKTLTYASFRGSEVRVDVDRIDHQAAESKGWNFQQVPKKYADSNVEHFVMVKRIHQGDTVEPNYNVCTICNTTMIEF